MFKLKNKHTVIGLFLVTGIMLAFSVLKEDSKINGMSFEGPASVVDHEEFNALRSSNSNWVSLMPYAYAGNGSSEIVFENLHWQWWGEGYEGTQSCIRSAHKNGLKVMLKPHLWVRHGSFTGDVVFDNEKDWEKWESDYERYLLKYARLAEEENVEIFCIGTELGAWVMMRPDSWEIMIQNVKKVYSGKLTYAGNWDSYKYFPLWDQLDFIGVDAYFPLSDSKEPSLDELSKAWGKWSIEMEGISKRFNKPVLFTEYGYRNIDFNTKKPWESYRNSERNDLAQKTAYEAIYRSLWNKQWLAGGFVWKWHASSQGMEQGNTKYTPQDKPAMEVIRKYYSK